MTYGYESCGRCGLGCVTPNTTFHPHVCPLPWTGPHAKLHASSLVDFHRYSQIPMHPRTLARCRVTLEC